MSISKSLLLCDKKTNFKDMDFFYPAVIYLAVLVATSLNDLFDIDVIKNLVVTGFTILPFYMEY